MEDKEKEEVESGGSSAEDRLKSTEGEFAKSMLRNNRQIRADRGLQLVNSSRTFYARHIDDIKMKIDNMDIDLAAMLDLSPTDKNALNFREFDGPEFVKQHSDLAVKIHTEKLRLNAAIKQYNKLYGHKYEYVKLDF